MKKKSDTREKVFETADELLKSGTKPTQQNVRQRMGTGSITTINSALNDWWQSLSERITRQQAHPELPEPVLAAANTLWDQSLAYAQHSLRKERAELSALIQQNKQGSEEKVIELRDRLDQMQGLNARLSEQNFDLSRSIDQAQQRCTELERELINLTAAKDEINRENKQLKLIQQQDVPDSGAATNSLIESDESLFDLKVDLKIKSNEIKQLKELVDIKNKEIIDLKHQLEQQEKEALQQKHRLELVIAQQDTRHDATLKSLNDCKEQLSLAHFSNKKD